MLLELVTQVWKKRAGSVISNEIIVSWNDRFVLRRELPENNEYMVWVFIEVFNKFGWMVKVVEPLSVLEAPNDTWILSIRKMVLYNPVWWWLLAPLDWQLKSIEIHHQSLPEAFPSDNFGFNMKNIVVNDFKRGFIVSNSKDDPTKDASSFIA